VLNGYESPVFSNLPNLPTAGLFGVTNNDELSTAEATVPSLALQSETLSPTNLSYFTEMDSNASHGTVSGDERASEEGQVHSRDYMPKLEVLTERFSFILGRKDNGYSCCERSKNMREKKNSKTIQTLNRYPTETRTLNN
jgi:hypothetical protein